jgi:hypothetical protein
LEVAASQLYEFWLIGVGSNWPHHWGLLLDGRLHIDVVNHFLIVALYGGLPAMFLYILSHWYALKRIVALFRSTGDSTVSKVAFHLGIVLVALDFSTLSVGLFGPPLPLSNMLLGLIVSVTAIEKLTEVSKDSLPATSLEDNKSGRGN